MSLNGGSLYSDLDNPDQDGAIQLASHNALAEATLMEGSIAEATLAFETLEVHTHSNSAHSIPHTITERSHQRSHYLARKRVSKHFKHESYAALDLGTNNCRLLIAVPSYNGFRVVDAFSRIVRLGEGLSASGRLSDAAIERTVEALEICAEKIKFRGASRLRLIATQACREANNTDAFLEKVVSRTGLNLEIVDQRTEAMLAADGCVSLLAVEAESAILFDIGGGSTEIVCLEKTDKTKPLREQIKAWTSIPVGVVSLSETHMNADSQQVIFQNMLKSVQSKLADFITEVGSATQRKGFHLIGTSGTVTTLAAMHLGLPRYERKYVDGTWLHNDDLSAIIHQVVKMSAAEKSDNPCIGQERSDLMLAGCAILEGIRLSFPAERTRIADRGLREGILMNMMRDDGVWRKGS